jgi:repressor LexA
MKYPVIAKRFEEIMNLRQIKATDLADKTGISKAAISQYVNGNRCPTSAVALKLGKVLNCSPMWLMDLSNNMYQEEHQKNPNAIPVLGRVAAGIPIDAIEEIIDYEEIDNKLASTGEFFGLMIKGDSMTPRICNGDVVIVRKQEVAESGDIVIATINGDDAVCKKLQIYDKAVLLYSLNPAYDPIDVTGREDFKIIGKVVELRGKF